jgi:hypothetical protein
MNQTERTQNAFRSLSFGKERFDFVQANPLRTARAGKPQLGFPVGYNFKGQQCCNA